MSEHRTEHLLQPEARPAILSTEVDALRGKLRNVKVQLLSLLVELDTALGDEPSVKTRAERRRR